MTITILERASIGYEDRGWTRGYATAAFDEFRDRPGYLELPPLRLAALQEIDPGAGYKMHHHEGIETITIMLRGTLAHDDSVGGKGSTGPDDVAVVSAGRGIDHEELATPDCSLRAVLFWIVSAEPAAEPRFEKRTFARADRQGRLVTVASGRAGAPSNAAPIRADVAIATGVLSTGASVTYELGPGRRAYLLSSDAAIDVADEVVQAGDRVIVQGPARLAIRAHGDTEVFLADLD